jgi:glycosyltransferase involved in cell wall biosynthesis
VAEGRSGDGTREILERMAAGEPRLRVVDNPGRIASSGLNRAIEAARGSVIVRMDAHTSYAPDYVSRCIETLEATRAANVGGPARTRPEPGEAWASAIAAAYHSPFAVGGARFHDEKYEGSVDTVTYGCWPRETFERFGLFDELLVRNQDDEHNLRITRGGGVVWQSPSIRSWYSPRTGLAGLVRQYAQYGYWKVRVIRKHRIPASLRHVVPPLFVLGLACGWTTAFVSRGVFVAYLGAIALYAALLAGFSVATVARSGWRDLPRLPIVFAAYHLSYGWGFLRGLVDSARARHGAGGAMTRLSRGPVEGAR